MDQEPVVIIGGVPRIMAPRPAYKGLWFIGYQLGPSMLGVVGKQSRPLARVIANDLQRNRSRRIRPRKQTSRPGHEVREEAWKW
jgi:hypothetical protein